MSVIVYSYASCGTCRKALAWLHERGIKAEVIDITREPPARALLEQALQELGDRRRLFNTSGQSYRALGAERVRAMADPEALEALAADGRLIKRPLLVTAEGRITTGFRPEEWQALLPQAAA
ncbi:MAG: Spx/MgsR family RNA polymerase-binding regulatory protein [Cyanobium sp.]